MGNGIDNNLINQNMNCNPLMLQNQINYFNNNEIDMNNPMLNQMNSLMMDMNNNMMNMNNQMYNPMNNMNKMNNQINNQMNNPINNMNNQILKNLMNMNMNNQMNNQMNNPMINQMNNQMINQMNNPMMNMNNQINNPMMNINNQMINPMKNMNNNMMNINQMNNPMINQMNYALMNMMKTNNQMNNNIMNMNNQMINTQINMTNINNIKIKAKSPMINMNNKMMIQKNNHINNINCPIMGQINNNIFNKGCNYNLNINLNLSENQMKLIKLIFKFYEEHKDSNKNIFMNFEHPQQVQSLINHLFPNYGELKQIYDDDNDKNNIYGELLPYIHEEKKTIKFINSNKILYNIKIPCSISKSDLYEIAKLYKGLNYSNIILVHNNNILNNDESSIENISTGDSIIIIEDRIYPDKSYYLSIQKKYENNNKNRINIVFNEFRGLIRRHNFVFSENTTITEMIYSINLFFGLDYRDLRLMYDMMTIKPNETNIFNYFRRSEMVTIVGIKRQNERNLTECKIIGKAISAKLLNDKNEEEFKVVVGRLNNTKVLFCPDIDHGFGSFKDNLRGLYNIYIGNIEIKFEDNQSFSSHGIKEDFACRIKLKNHK